MTPEHIVTLLGASGAGAVFLALVNGFIKWLSGASAREQKKNTDLLTQRVNAVKDRDAAIDELDVEARKRREAEEHVSILWRQLTENGIKPRSRTYHNQYQE